MNKKEIMLALLLLVVLCTACGKSASNHLETIQSFAVVVSPSASPSPTPCLKVDSEVTASLTPDDFKWASESVGGLHYGMSDHEVLSLLGIPQNKSTASPPNQSGDVYQLWSYTDKGIFINITWNDLTPESAQIYNYVVTPPFKGETAKGIRIYSKTADVLRQYGSDINYSAFKERDGFTVGSEQGGIQFITAWDHVVKVGAGVFADWAMPWGVDAAFLPYWHTTPTNYIGMTGQEIYARFGKPVEVISSLGNREVWYYDNGLEFTLDKSNFDSYERYVVKDFEDYSWVHESLGQFKIGMTASKYKKLLGVPELKGPILQEDSDYRDWSYQLWSYPSKGIEFYLDLDRNEILSLHVYPPFSGQTSRSISIGSTALEVLAACNEGIYPERNYNPAFIYVGTDNYILKFALLNDKVSDIYIGSFQTNS